MRKSFILFSVFALVILTSAILFAGTAAKDSPETITIDACADKQAPVEFPHKSHQELTECSTCHHTQEGLKADSATVVEPCRACHVEPEAATTPVCSQMSTKKNPFHLTCITCHKESGKENAPTKCVDCHPKG